MSKSIRFASLAAALALATTCFAQAPAGAPAGTTGLCKDGSYYSGATRKGACAGHKGVKEWYGQASGSTSAAPAAAAPAAAARTVTPAAPAAGANTAPAATAPAMPAAAPASKATKTAPGATAAAGGGPGLVWVNKSTKAYHCAGDKWYGKTKDGEYLSEADAKSQGLHAAHGKACR